MGDSLFSNHIHSTNFFLHNLILSKILQLIFLHIAKIPGPFEQPVRILRFFAELRFYLKQVNILVSGNLDSGILETDIPEEGNSLIGLFTTYQVVRYCQAQSRFAVL